jgi:hypothetical protein
MTDLAEKVREFLDSDVWVDAKGVEEYDLLAALLSQVRDEALEEAAKVADEWADAGGHVGTVGEHIRALRQSSASGRDNEQPIRPSKTND